MRYERSLYTFAVIKKTENVIKKEGKKTCIACTYSPIFGNEGEVKNYICTREY